jgi:hypothetical protein
MITRLIRQLVARGGYEIRRAETRRYGNPVRLEKARSTIERFREVISDPLNLLIARVPQAGFVDAAGCVVLHNGHRVPVSGPGAYYGEFSELLVLNRGVHEPLEEYCFQTLLSRLQTPEPVMIELGAYWAHYSMWLQQRFPGARCVMVEPSAANLQCGRNNFARHGYQGEFIQAFVGATAFQIDRWRAERAIGHLDILHADIQGYEGEMLDGAEGTLSRAQADYVFISTHSETLHQAVVERLGRWSYRVEVSSGVDTHTTSWDGFVLASSPHVAPLLRPFTPLGRLEIVQASPVELLQSLNAAASWPAT